MGPVGVTSARHTAVRYERTVRLGPRTVRIGLVDAPLFASDDRIICGYPLADLSHIPLDNPAENADLTTGAFAIIAVDDAVMRLTSDYCGGYRLYWREVGSDLFVSDSWRWILEQSPDQEVRVDEYELFYWQRHGYTSGGKTFVRSLSKLPPASVLTISEQTVEAESYFPDITNTPSSRKYREAIWHSLLDAFTWLEELRRPVTLLFSGGADSCLLAAAMKDVGLDFTAVCLQLQPGYVENLNDVARADKIAKRMSIPLDVINVSIDDALQMCDEVMERMLFDRHVSLLHFGGMQRIAEQYGRDTILVCGQAADSILSYGPTCRTRGDLVARLLNLGPRQFLTPLLTRLVKWKSRLPLRGPVTDSEFHAAFFDQHYYYSVLETDLPHDYLEYVHVLANELAGQHSSRASRLMRLKIHGFVQGSDNQVVLQAARAAGIYSIVLPFTSPEIIRATMQYRSQLADLRAPKYPVHQLLRQHSVPVHAGRSPVPESTDTIPLLELEQMMRERFYETAESLFTPQIVGEGLS